MAAIVQEHALAENRPRAAADTERVRQFIQKRRAEILDDLTPEPPPWPGPTVVAEPPVGSEQIEVVVRFETSWGTNKNPDPFAGETVTYLTISGTEVPTDGTAAIAGHASAEERAGLGIEEAASIAMFSVQPGGSVEGLTLVLPLARMASDTTLVIGSDLFGGGVWTIPAGSRTPDSYTPFTEGTLSLVEAGTADGATVLGSFTGTFG